jgi:hypothetical protein
METFIPMDRTAALPYCPRLCPATEGSLVMSDLPDERQLHEQIAQQRAETNMFWVIAAYCILVLLCLIIIAACQVEQVVVLLGKA